MTIKQKLAKRHKTRSYRKTTTAGPRGKRRLHHGKGKGKWKILKEFRLRK